MDLREVTFLILGSEIRPEITMPTSATVFQLKEKIAEQTRIPVDRQNLLYENIKLMDVTTLDEYNFGAFTELHLAVDLYPGERVIDINISSPAFKIGLRVNKIHKVIQVKEKLAEVCAVETKDITLWHMNTKMLDDKALYKYFVTDGSEILFTRTGVDI